MVFMTKISIISSSIRTGRKSHRVALYFKKYLENNELATVEILDLGIYGFPLFNERLQYQKDPPGNVLEFAAKISASDGIIIVTPEYNGGYPASLKNAIDLLYKEWYRKPVAISTVSDGNFAGSQVLISLQFTLWKMKAWTVPALFPVPDIDSAFDADGNPADMSGVEKRTANFVNELFWYIRAKASAG
jgi:NAD(P)H-dependent FMN reductase